MDKTYTNNLVASVKLANLIENLQKQVFDAAATLEEILVIINRHPELNVALGEMDDFREAVFDIKSYSTVLTGRAAVAERETEKFITKVG